MREKKDIGEGMQPGVDKENEGEAGCIVRLKAGMLGVRECLAVHGYIRSGRLQERACFVLHLL